MSCREVYLGDDLSKAVKDKENKMSEAFVKIDLHGLRQGGRGLTPIVE